MSQTLYCPNCGSHWITCQCGQMQSARPLETPPPDPKSDALERLLADMDAALLSETADEEIAGNLAPKWADRIREMVRCRICARVGCKSEAHAANVAAALAEGRATTQIAAQALREALDIHLTNTRRSVKDSIVASAVARMDDRFSAPPAHPGAPTCQHRTVTIIEGGRCNDCGLHVDLSEAVKEALATPPASSVERAGRCRMSDVHYQPCDCGADCLQPVERAGSPEPERADLLVAALARIEYWGRADVANSPTDVKHRMWKEAKRALDADRPSAPSAPPPAGNAP